MRTMLAVVAAASLVALAAAAAPAGEQLVLKPYPGPTPWKHITDQHKGGAWYREQIPGDQTVDGFRDILTDEAHPEWQGADPADILKSRFQVVAQSCTGVRVNGPVPQTEGGHAVAYGQLYCGQQNGKPFGVQVFFKVIAGDAAAYVISRDVHVQPSPDGGQLSFPKGHEQDAEALLRTDAEANIYLTNSVYLCGGGSTDARCGGQR
ncbi:MAG: hypothetical protein ACHP7N_12660 [Caulobacterales bacterium]